MPRPEAVSEFQTQLPEPSREPNRYRDTHRRNKKPFTTWLPVGASEQVRDLADELRYKQRDRSISAQSLVVEALNMLMLKYNYPPIIEKPAEPDPSDFTDHE
jgi:hypothetical protein